MLPSDLVGSRVGTSRAEARLHSESSTRPSSHRQCVRGPDSPAARQALAKSEHGSPAVYGPEQLRDHRGSRDARSRSTIALLARSAKVPKCQSAKVPKCQSAKVPKCQAGQRPKKIAGLPRWLFSQSGATGCSRTRSGPPIAAAPARATSDRVPSASSTLPPSAPPPGVGSPVS